MDLSVSGMLVSWYDTQPPVMVWLEIYLSNATGLQCDDPASSVGVNAVFLRGWEIGVGLWPPELHSAVDEV